MGSTSASNGLILLTGGTGHIGFATLRTALTAGYSVRAAIRRESSISEITAVKSIQPYLSALTFVTVPDIEVPGAFDAAVQGVDYVIHLASPLAIPSDDHEKTIIQPAIRGTLGILESALKEKSIKRVVITASIVSVLPLGAFGPGLFEEVVHPNDVVPDMHGPYGDAFHAYAASKNRAYNASRQFMQEKNPSFDLVNVMPAFVVGKNELATTRERVLQGTNRLGMQTVFGAQNPDGLTALTCHVDDVAEVHVRSLDSEKVPKGINLGVVYKGLEGGIVWDDAMEIVKKHFPKEVEEGLFPLGGHVKSKPLRWDASATEKVLGLKFKSWEEMVVSVARAYVEAEA